MKTALTPFGDLRPADLQAWAELAEHASEPNPFLHPDFVGAAALALRPRGLAVLRCEDAGGWVACLPVVPVAWRRNVLGPGLAAWRHTYCYLGTPLVAAGAEAEGVRGLLAAARRRRSVAFLACDWLRDGAVVALLEQEVGATVTTDRFSRAFVRRPAAVASAVRPMTRKAGKELRRQRRGLAEAVGGELDVVERQDTADAVRDFLALEAAGWKGRGGTALASHPGHGRMLGAVCERFAARGDLQLLALGGGGSVAAMQCNLRSQDGLFCFKVAYDEGLGRHAPGVQLEVAALDRLAHDERTAWMDSCAAPDNALLERLWPERTPITSVVVPRGVAGRAVVRGSMPVLRAARAARHRLPRRSDA